MSITAEAIAGEALGCEWAPGTPPHVIGRRLILRHNARRGWYTAPPALYEELPQAPELSTNALREWRRLPTAGEVARCSYVHVYDRAGSYLSIAQSAMLPVGTPAWHEGAVFAKEPGKSAPAGLWHVEVDYDGSPWNGRELPAVCDEGARWLWSDALRAALDCGYMVRAGSGAILWPEQHHILGTWAKHIWEARLELQEQLAAGVLNEAEKLRTREALALVKGVYTQTIGMFGKTNYERPALTDEERAAGIVPEVARWYRPEWHRVILASALARMFYQARKSEALGMPPLFWRVDSIAFASDDNPAITAAAAGLFVRDGACGAFRHEYSVPMGELLATRAHTIEVGGHRHKLPGVRM